MSGDAALIGFGTHTGTVSAASDWDGEHETKQVLPSRPDSHERLFHDTGLPRFLLPLTDDDALIQAFAEPRLERYIGVICRPATERWSHHSESVPFQEYDAFVWFDETRALEPLGSVAPHDTVPDTYPFGL